MSDVVYVNIKPRTPQDNLKARQMDFHGCWYHTIHQDKSTGVTFNVGDWLVWTNGDFNCPMVYSDKEFNDVFYVVHDTAKSLCTPVGPEFGCSNRTCDYEVPPVDVAPVRIKAQAALDLMNELVHSL